MNNQEFFDKTATHLFTQGKQATDGQTCLYRTPDGLKCAIGCHIPDDKYDPKMEFGDHGPGSTPGFILQEVLGLDLIDIELANDLQNVHDDDASWFDTRTMRSELAFVAATYRLDPSILTTLSLP